MADEATLVIIQIINVICCLAGFGIFTITFTYSRKITQILKETKIVKRWRIATYMVGFFSIGYLINIPLVFFFDLTFLLFVEGMIFLVGSMFVLLVFHLAFKTYDLIYSLT